MGLSRVNAGRDVPNDFNVIVEIPANSAPIKYEVDKQSGALFVDRFVGTAMHYPCNYGYVPRTIADDGDPVDVCVITPFPLMTGTVIRCRPLAALIMEDEGGVDWKILAVPIAKVCGRYAAWRGAEDVPCDLLEQIRHFFEHYKDLEPGKWVKVKGWKSPGDAAALILEGARAYEAMEDKPQTA
ncbi:MAG: inorganic diphosphatase [Duodenibacillus sp.]|nr:inorganic diphosphatase [Duodenibacillus sp.]